MKNALYNKQFIVFTLVIFRPIYFDITKIFTFKLVK